MSHLTRDPGVVDNFVLQASSIEGRSSHVVKGPVKLETQTMFYLRNSPEPCRRRYVVESCSLKSLLNNHPFSNQGDQRHVHLPPRWSMELLLFQNPVADLFPPTTGRSSYAEYDPSIAFFKQRIELHRGPRVDLTSDEKSLVRKERTCLSSGRTL
jgi:hypothetical protein